MKDQIIKKFKTALILFLFERRFGWWDWGDGQNSHKSSGALVAWKASSELWPSLNSQIRIIVFNGIFVTEMKFLILDSWLNVTMKTIKYDQGGRNIGLFRVSTNVGPGETVIFRSLLSSYHHLIYHYTFPCWHYHLFFASLSCS